MSENVFVTTTRAGGEESGEVVSLSSPRVLDPRLPSGTHLTPLGLFLKFCTSRVSSSFNLKREKKKKKRATHRLRYPSWNSNSQKAASTDTNDWPSSRQQWSKE